MEEQKDFLTAFLSAKRVEGCSDKTIHYYKITLEKMITALAKPVQATTTDDMRRYLDKELPEITCRKKYISLSTYWRWRKELLLVVGLKAQEKNLKF